MRNIVNQLIRHEGLKLKPYRCTAGKLTIGVGRNIEDNGITEEEAMMMLRNDIETISNELALAVAEMGITLRDVEKMGQVRVLTLTNLAFNMGVPRLLGFKKTFAALKEHDYETAADEMLNSKWSRQVGNRAIELAEQMRTGEWQ